MDSLELKEEDMVSAMERVKPSVSAKELARFELLARTF